VTTLGRGGGDYTAALLGAAIGATEVCLWTDVSGILTADPKIVPEARTLAELSYVEAAEIAAFGPEVLHPRTIAPVAESGITLRIANLLRPDHPGTRIVANPAPTERAARAIISAGSLSLISIAAAGADGWTPHLAARAIERLTLAGVEILTFAQSFSERTLTLAVRGADAAFAQVCLTALFEREQSAGTLRQISITEPVALVAVISAPNGLQPAPRTLTALGQAGAHVLALAQSTNAYHISFLLPEAEVTPVVQALHRELGLG
jgi:aspartate kinase